MKKYKVQFIETTSYVIDVLAHDEQEATDIATEKFVELDIDDLEHYQETQTETNTGNVYDVTDTDDPFNPSNK